MEANIYLCTISELDREYKNVLDFASLASQTAWFDKQIQKMTAGNYIVDSEQESYVLKCTLKEIEKFDYLFLRDATNKRFYYFITKKHYKTSETCIVEVELDVWSTYLFDFYLKESFVERCHVNRWKTAGSYPNENEVVDEGFADFTKQIYKQDRAELMDGCYIYTATQPLGIGIASTGSGGGGGGSCQSSGVLSYDGFRFIKGFEAFSDYGLYLNGERFRTVGYGFTETSNGEAYNQHKPFPCTEKLASELYGKYIIENWCKPIWRACVNNGISDLISYNMFDAMCSLAWTCGVGGFLSYDESPWQLIKDNPLNPNIRGVWEKFAITSSGTVLEGLKARRKAEADIYFLAKYEKRAIAWYTDNGQGLGIYTQKGYVKDNNGDGYVPPEFVKCQAGAEQIIDGDNNGWLYPTTGRITASYPDYKDGFFHGGIDFADDLNTPIKAIGDGVVVQKNTSETGYGKHLILEHVGRNGITYRVWYAHLNEFALSLKVGDKVKAGDVIGLMGSTGNSTGSHLHLEMRRPPYRSGSYNVLNGAPNYSVGDTIHPAKNLKVGDIIG